MISQKNAELYAAAKQIFFAALELDAARHDEFILKNCGGNADLRREVESLLAVRGNARDFLESPAIETNFNHENLENKIIGGYRLLREIGAGGMGVVFLAEKEDAEFSRQVALKLVKSNLCSKAIFKRFNLERQILASLEHPNIARLIDGGATNDGSPYFVMEYVAGVSLIEYAEAENLSLGARLELFRQVCAAVSFAHQHAVIHRDLKPSNILVTKNGTVKLLDFGVAKMLSSDTAPPIETAPTFRAMTPEYASPEQITGETVTTVADVYSLGVILYRLLTGASPYQTDAENLNEIIRAVCEIEPPRPSAVIDSRFQIPDSRFQIPDFKFQIPNSRFNKDNPKFQIPDSRFNKDNPKSKIRNPKSLRGDLDNIILKSLRKEPARRYASVEALSEDLRRYQAGLPVLAGRITFAYRTEKFVRRNRSAVALAALVMLALLGGIAATIWQARRAEQERARAERRFNDVRGLANSFMFEFNDEILKGQTQGRELVVKRALEYLDSLAAEAKNDASLQRELAIAYLKIGDIQGKPYSPNLGETEGAFESYCKAVTILEILRQADTENREIQRDLATAYLNVGSLQILRALKKDGATENLQKARMLGEALITAEPQNVEYRRLSADIDKSFGDALVDRDERIAAYQKALELREGLAMDDPTNATERTAGASIHQRIGTVLEHKGNVVKNTNNYSDATNYYRAALENFEDALATYKELLAAEPNNSRHRRNVADLTAMQIPVLANLGNNSEALKSYQTSLEIFEELSAADPKNAEARLDIAYTHQIMCRTLLKSYNDTNGAIKSCRQGLQVGKLLLALDPTNTEVRVYVVMNYNYIAQARKNAGDLGGAIESLRQALEAAESHPPTESEPRDIFIYAAEIRREIGNIYGVIAANPKTSAQKKKENRQAACRGFALNLNGWRDLQNRNAVRETDFNTIREAERQVSDCNEILK